MIPDHPDELQACRQAKDITRGSMQAVDDQALKAYHRAIEQGRSMSEAERIFFETYTSAIALNITR